MDIGVGMLPGVGSVQSGLVAARKLLTGEVYGIESSYIAKYNSCDISKYEMSNFP